jgi:hypothetical protein
MTNAQILKVTHFPYVEYDESGNKIYMEDKNGYWIKRKYDDSGNNVYWENSKGYWMKSEYDQSGKEIYWEDSVGKIWRP